MFHTFHERRARFFAHRGGRGGGRGSRHRERPDTSSPEQRLGRGGRLGSGGGGAGRIFGRGDLRLLLLSFIEQKPCHGYELIKELETKFGGGYAPSPGSVYPTLMLLEELDYIRTSASDGQKKLFEVTPAGRAYLRENEAALRSAIRRMEIAARAVAGDLVPHDIHHAMHTLKAALQFHRGGWGEAEVLRVQKILEEAAEMIARERSSD